VGPTVGEINVLVGRRTDFESVAMRSPCRFLPIGPIVEDRNFHCGDLIRFREGLDDFLFTGDPQHIGHQSHELSVAGHK